jgi:hypothetical protein
MKCPILKSKEYKQGFNTGLTFDGFRGKGILWKIEEHKEMKRYGWKYFQTSKKIKWTAKDYLARIEASYNELFKLYKII